MRDESALLNVIDVEATCWDGQPPPGSVNEIIEIGLTVVDVSDDAACPGTVSWSVLPGRR